MDSNTRSRPTHDAAYSPSRTSASVSRDPPPDTALWPYTFPVEKHTMRAPANRSAPCTDATTFWVHVPTGSPEVPNFCPTIQMTLAAFGSAATACGSARSARIVSTPRASSEAATEESAKRETAITRRDDEPSARRAIVAMLGPILPPAPSTSRSPSSDVSAATVAPSGVASRALSSASVAITRGHQRCGS